MLIGVEPEEILQIRADGTVQSLDQVPRRVSDRGNEVVAGLQEAGGGGRTCAEVDPSNIDANSFAPKKRDGELVRQCGLAGPGPGSLAGWRCTTLFDSRRYKVTIESAQAIAPMIRPVARRAGSQGPAQHHRTG